VLAHPASIIGSWAVCADPVCPSINTHRSIHHHPTRAVWPKQLQLFNRSTSIIFEALERITGKVFNVKEILS
jgi:hypothetical protein